MKNPRGLSLIEIILALLLLASTTVVVLGVIGQGLMVMKKSKNNAIASNLAISQFEVYKNKFHMIPFYPGTASGAHMYPNRNNPSDADQTGKFVYHAVNTALLPGGASAYHGTDDFYHDPSYDLDNDGYADDIVEPLGPIKTEGVTFIPVVEIKSWNNGFNINRIKHMVVTVYWEENISGLNSRTASLSFEGFIIRTQPDPW